jgi:hypothetical protein
VKAARFGAHASRSGPFFPNDLSDGFKQTKEGGAKKHQESRQSRAEKTDGGKFA